MDKRQSYLFNELQKVTFNLTNVRMTNDRYATIWGGASLLKVLLNALSDLLSWSLEWDYAINLSESDFPVKPLERLEWFLLANRGFNFVKSHGQDISKFIKKQGLDRTFHECENRMWKLGKRKLLTSIKWDGGSDWIGITKDFAYFLVNSNNSLVNGLLQIYSYTLLPAESFFHTVLHNSEFCHKVIDNNLHMTNWKRKSGCRCQHKHIVDWCGCSPNDYSMSDWPIIKSSMNKAIYFARKFEPVVSLSIVNRVESWILGNNYTLRALTHPSFNSYWENVFEYNLDRLEGSQLIFYTGLQLMSLSHINYLCHQQNHQNYYSNYESSEMYLDLLELTALNSIHYYFTNDEFSGLLITLNVTIDDASLGEGQQYNLMKEKKSPSSSTSKNVTTYIESFFKPQSTFSHEKKVNLNSQITLVRATVCSNLDRKELIFRNFPCILSPQSEIVVALDWKIEVNESPNLFSTGNVSSVLELINPNGSIHESVISYNLTQILEGDSDSLMAVRLSNRVFRVFFHPNINYTLVPGSWKLKVKYFPYLIVDNLTSNLILESAKVAFIILPQITPHEGDINYGKGNKKSLNLLKDWFTLFFDVTENVYKVNNNANDKSIEYSLKKMLYETWILEQMCFTQVFCSEDEKKMMNESNIEEKDNSEQNDANESGENIESKINLLGEGLDEKNDNPYVTGDAFYSKCLSQAFNKESMVKSCKLVPWSSFSSDPKSNLSIE